MSASLFLTDPGRCLPQSDLTEANLDLVIQQQALEIERQLAHSREFFLQGGLERLQHEPHKLGDPGSNPGPATNSTAAPAEQLKSSASEAPPIDVVPQQTAVNQVQPGAAEIQIWMCAWCKRPYNARGEHVKVPKWAEPDEWSHGCCPECCIDVLKEASR